MEYLPQFFCRYPELAIGVGNKRFCDRAIAMTSGQMEMLRLQYAVRKNPHLVSFVRGKF